MSQSRGRPSGGPVSCCGGPPFGELSGGKWMTELATALKQERVCHRSDGLLRYPTLPGFKN